MACFAAIKNGIDVKDEGKIKLMLETLTMDVVYDNGVQQIIVNGFNTTPYLREHYMSRAASDISAHPCVRYKMVEIQRELAKTYDLILDGRDIGTFVVPDANCKIFLVASPEERARRRVEENKLKGQESDYETVLADIKQRDYNDSHREVAPLKKADDAIELETTTMSIAEVVDAVIKIVKEKI